MAEEVPHSSSKYQGNYEKARFEGEGVYEFADGTVYRGQMHNGMFHGKGTLTFETGVYEGIWENGREVDGTFIFNDGLPFQKNNWTYCTLKDRRFWSEMQGEIKPAGETQRTNKTEKPSIPPGTFDVSNGYYDPTTKYVHDYESHEKIRQPTSQEIKFIESKAPISSARPEAAAAPAEEGKTE